ncbi:MAG: heat-inducible transcription repressor HrcA [Deltaproteobacteria bacterium RBG_16_47_11]|nr:MAG: heat-inducible transcription repressor HrcA [Deltaproteobacteria bacterium RBG_16_47_11]
MVLFLSERMKDILRIVIEDYILTAEPVGSRSISRKLELPLSPATIRNMMSDMEELGLLFQPHTSAGRVPTEKGFRFYIDSILNIHELSGEEQENLRARYLRHPNFQLEGRDLFRETCRILSASSQYLGVVWAPRMSLLVLQHIEFVKLRKNLILAILVSTTGMVQNRIFELEEDLTQSDLDHLSNYLSGQLTGLSLYQVREKLLDQMRVEKITYDHLLEQAIKLGERAFSSFDETDVFIEGRTNILREPEFGNISIMTNLFQAFEEKATMVKLLDQCTVPRGVQIAIGSESQVQEMETCSLVTSTYGCEGRTWGALGVIGPRRMNYSKVIPLVDYSAKLLSEILETYYH